MDEKQLIQFCKNATWDEIKKLPSINNRCYITFDLQTDNKQSGNPHYTYLTFFSEQTECGKDRYIGSSTTNQKFMEDEYKGSPKKYKDLFEKSLSMYEHRVVCLKTYDDQGTTLLNEQFLLQGVDAKNNSKFFNDVNHTGGKSKTLILQTALKHYITRNIKIANSHNKENCKFKTGFKSIKELYEMQNAQPRSDDFDEQHSNSINKEIRLTKGDALKNCRHTIILEDFYEKGKHQRGGNTHTIAACAKDNVKNYVSDDGLPCVYIPKSVWSQCTNNTLQNILLWDNRLDYDLPRKPTDQIDIITACSRHMKEYSVGHLDQSVKELALDLGMLESEWTGSNGYRAKLKEIFNNIQSNGVVPVGYERIKYTETSLKQWEDENSNDKLTAMALSTVYAGSSFNGYQRILDWISNPDNLHRQLRIGFFHGESFHQTHVDAWDDKKSTVESTIKSIFSNFFKMYIKDTEKVVTKKDDVIFDVLLRYRTKQNPVGKDAKKAA